MFASLSAAGFGRDFRTGVHVRGHVLADGASDFRRCFVAPVNAEHHDIRVRVLRLDIANPHEAEVFVAANESNARVSREHFRFPSGLEFNSLRFFHLYRNMARGNRA